MLDKHVMKIATSVRARFDKTGKDDLDCLCGIVSAKLSVALKKAKVKHVIKLAKGEECILDCHVFIVTAGSMLLDLTARQFDSMLEPIVYRKWKGDKESQWWWHDGATFKTAASLVKHQLKEGWDKSQIAIDILA